MFSLIWFLLIGLAAGWSAGQIMKGRSLGLVGSLIVGVVGSILGGYLFRLIWLVGFAAIGTLGSLISATLGAIVLLFVLQKVKR